jgi:two-component system chemotaxis sensor kinase CheA
MEDQEIVREFLIESHENLARLDQEMVELEKRPRDTELLASVFRTVHTIKGTCGFLGFTHLEGITHLAENILNQLRSGERELTPELVSLILETVDAIKKVLKIVEASGTEGAETYQDLRRRQQLACDSLGAADGAKTQPEAAEAEAVAVEGPAPEAAPDAALEAAAPESEGAGAQKGSSVADSTIRVDVGLLDKLMNLVGELVLARNQILQYSARQEDATLNATSQRLNLITTQLQAGVMKTRMQPIRVVWNKLPRVVRDLASACGKQIQLELDGADTELDKSIIEAIKDPLTHIVRNCCDHGIETPPERIRHGKPAQGRLSLRAYHEGGQVNIEISDDGAGIDPQRVKSKALQKGLLRPEQADRMSERDLINLLFLPGFSTADEVTNLSGRGVGLDVVKTNIENIGGVVDLASRTGEGTTVKIKIPLTLAIIPGLVVTTGGERFVIPQVSLLELIRLEGETGKKQIERIHGTPVYRRRGTLLPIAYLNGVLQLGGSGDEAEVINIVVLQAEDRQFGLVVDGISDTQEIVVKPLGKQLKGLSWYAGATIMGDGKVALILDVLGLGQLAGVLTESREQARAEAERKEQLAGSDRQTFLLFRAGSFHRLAVPLSLVARLEEFPQAKVERASGRLVVQYRNRILPLVPLGPALDPGSEDTAGRQDPVQVIVFSDGERGIGILVDQILDIVEETLAIKQATQRPGLLGSAVIGQKVTDLLDLQTVIARGTEDWFGRHTRTKTGGTSVLVAEGSAFTRGLLRHHLEMAGYRVLEASTDEEALARLEQHKVDVVVAALDLPSHGGAELLKRMRRQPNLTGIPVLGLASVVEETLVRPAGEENFQDYQVKSDRDAMLRSVEKLAAAVGAASQIPETVAARS